MGTHPIFESDFDCLTEIGSKIGETKNCNFFVKSQHHLNVKNRLIIMPVTNRGRHQGRARGQPRKPNNNQRQVYRQYADRDSSFVWLIFGYFALLVLDLILKFRLEYIFPLGLLFQEVLKECKLSSLSSFFFIAVTLCTDYTIHMLTQSLGKELFLLAGFLVWWQLVCSGESRLSASTLSLCVVLCAFECFVTYKNIRNDQWMYHSPAVRPLALHCIGFPLVSIGYCVKRYIAYLMRIRKQREVDANNKFHFQLLHDALPPGEFMGHNYADPMSDSSSEDTSVIGEQQEQSTPHISWIQRIREVYSDVACFTRTTTPLVQVKSPTPSQTAQQTQQQAHLQQSTPKPNHSSLWSSLHSQWSSLYVYFRRSTKSQQHQATTTATSSTSTHHQQSSSSSTPSRITSNSEKVHPTPPSSSSSNNVTHHERKNSARSSKSNSVQKSENSPARSSPASSSAPQAPVSSEHVESAPTTRQRHRKPKVDNQDYQELLQIKPQSVDMARDSELEKLKSKIRSLEGEKNDLVKQLHTKNDDLTRHEHFTSSELDSMKKREETLKTELDRERRRRQDLELLLRREEESRKLGERQLQEERRRAQNTSELDNMRNRLRHQESVDEKNRTEMNNLREAKNALANKLAQLEMQFKTRHQTETQQKFEIAKMKNQLKEENKIKINLMSELTRKTQQQQAGPCKQCSQQQRQHQQPPQPRNYSPQNMFSIEPNQPTSHTAQEHDGSPNGSFSSSVQQNGFNASFHQDMDSFETHSQFHT